MQAFLRGPERELRSYRARSWRGIPDARRFAYGSSGYGGGGTPKQSHCSGAGASRFNGAYHAAGRLCVRAEASGSGGNASVRLTKDQTPFREAAAREAREARRGYEEALGVE